MTRRFFTDANEGRGACICGKQKFDKRTAQTKRNYMNDGRSGNRRQHKVKRSFIYQCPHSGAWHITRQQTYEGKPNY